jgi:hypothetical protein
MPGMLPGLKPRSIGRLSRKLRRGAVPASRCFVDPADPRLALDQVVRPDASENRAAVRRLTDTERDERGIPLGLRLKNRSVIVARQRTPAGDRRFRG